jgi:signal recognition particle receptor subunit beta
VESFTFKVVVAGPFGVGKTTLIQHISSVPVVGTEVPTTGTEALVKETTTVGIEYGVLVLEDADLRAELVLIGTPGQARFDIMRDVARIGMDGLLLLVDASDPSTWDEARELADALLGETLAPMVVGANRWEAANGQLGALRRRLGLGDDIPILRCNVVDAQSARDLVVELLAAVLDELTPSAHLVGDQPWPAQPRS